jgi:hydroxyacylglutathione hydrolase
MRLSESIYWIAGGYVGPYFSDAGDCNVYLLKGPGGYVMFDAGGGKKPELIEQQLKWDSVAPKDIRAIVVTHSHRDHVGGLPYWKEKTGARIVAPRDAAAHLTQGGPYPGRTDGSGVIPPCAPDQLVSGGETFDLCGIKFEAIHAPGHCAHMLCYLTTIDGVRLLVTGDCFYWGGQITILKPPDGDPKVFKQTLLKLNDIHFDAFLPGHRFPVLKGGHEHIELACQNFNP